MKTENVKVFAVSSMLVEHIVRVVWPEWTLAGVMIGRLAFPLFALALAFNVWHYSRDGRAAVWRLFGWAVIAQVPFLLCWGYWQGNVLFTLAIGLWVCVEADSRERWPLAVAIVLPLEMIYLVWGVPVIEFGGCGVLAVVVAWELVTGNVNIGVDLRRCFWWVAFAGACFAASLGWGWPVALAAPLGVPWWFILNRVGVEVPFSGRSWRWAWYAVYPVHLAVLAVVGMWRG